MNAFIPFVPTSSDLRPFAAEIWLIVGIAANLIVPFGIRRPNRVCAVVTLAVLFVAVLSLTWPAIDPSHSSHLRGLLLFDSTAQIWKIILLTFTAGVVLLWLDHSGRHLRQGDGPEFFVLLLGATLGMCLMASTTHLLMIFMTIAMASLPSYLLAGFSKTAERGAEASLKYVLFGAVTGAVLIYGLSFIYGMYGTLQLGDLAAHRAPSAALALGMVGLLIGIGFKISAVPLHFWCPDVFEGSSIEVTTFLSVASKGAALVLLLRITQLLGGSHLGWVIGAFGVLTATVGNVAAFTQSNIKRLLAYSSIAQAGYMMSLIAGAGSPDKTSAAAVEQGLLIYLLVYAVTNLGAFSVAAFVIRQTDERVENFAGLGRSSPLLAGSMFCCLISLIGLPPFAGFGAKVNILWVLAAQGAFGKALVAIVVVNTVLSAFYYFRLIRLMYLRSSASAQSNQLWTRHPIGAFLGLGCAAGLVVMFFLFGRLFSFTAQPISAAGLQAADRGAPQSVAAAAH